MLHNWLQSDSHSMGASRMERLGPRAGEMGGLVEVLVVAAGSGGLAEARMVQATGGPGYGEVSGAGVSRGR